MLKQKKKSTDNAYKIIDKKVISSKPYINFIYNLIESEGIDKKLKYVFEEDKKTNFELFIKAANYLSVMNNICDSFGLSDEFSKIIVQGVKSDDPFDTVIDTHFVETKYGNSSKKDLTNIDALFTILESVVGLDSIIDYVENKQKLFNRLNRVNRYNEEETNNFIILFKSLYEDVKNLNNYNEVKEVIKGYSESLKPYINDGNTLMLQDMDKNEDNDYGYVDGLITRVTDVLSIKKGDVK